jgi:molybdenum cofactor sulfurtransferase
MLGLLPFMSQIQPGANRRQLQDVVGFEFGIVRVSFGLVSNFRDAWAVACWAREGVAANWGRKDQSR